MWVICITCDTYWCEHVEMWMSSTFSRFTIQDWSLPASEYKLCSTVYCIFLIVGWCTRQEQSSVFVHCFILMLTCVLWSNKSVYINMIEGGLTTSILGVLTFCSPPYSGSTVQLCVNWSYLLLVTKTALYWIYGLRRKQIIPEALGSEIHEWINFD